MRRLYHKFKVNKIRNWAISLEKGNMENIRLCPLTREEKGLLIKTWGGLGLNINPLFYQMFKTVEGFNEQYLSDDLFFPLIIKTLNPDNLIGALEHKGLYQTFYKELHQPNMLLQRINGVYYNSKMEIIDLVDMIKSATPGRQYIIKPTVGSGMGRGVKKISFNTGDLEDTIKLINGYGDNIVVQEVVEQSIKTSIFNKESLNAFRVSTLNINGKVTLCTVIFRCGRNGFCVDNAGAGGIVVGVREDGQFYEYGYDNKYKRHYQSDSGVKFGETKIEEVKDLVDLVLYAHRKYLPICGFAGWDFALDINNKPVFIEVNLGFPGIQLEQLCPAKPIFGERTQEVIEFVNKHQKLI